MSGAIRGTAAAGTVARGDSGTACAGRRLRNAAEGTGDCLGEGGAGEMARGPGTMGLLMAAARVYEDRGEIGTVTRADVAPAGAVDIRTTAVVGTGTTA